MTSNLKYYSNSVNVKSKAISVKGRGGLEGCEMLRIPHFLGNGFIVGG
jgi:hypothetical protein